MANGLLLPNSGGLSAGLRRTKILADGPVSNTHPQVPTDSQDLTECSYRNIPKAGIKADWLHVRLSCKSFTANAARLQLHALAYNLANFVRTLVLPNSIADWSLTSLRDRMIKIGAKVIQHARSIILQLAEVAVPHDLWAEMLTNISDLKARAQAP